MPIRRTELKKVISEVPTTVYACSEPDCQFASDSCDDVEKHEFASHEFCVWHDKSCHLVRIKSREQFIAWLDITRTTCMKEMGECRCFDSEETQRLIRDLKDQDFPLTFYYEFEDDCYNYGEYLGAKLSVWEVSRAIERLTAKAVDARENAKEYDRRAAALISREIIKMDQFSSDEDRITGIWTYRRVYHSNPGALCYVIYGNEENKEKYARFDLDNWIFIEAAPMATNTSEMTRALLELVDSREI